MMNFFERLYLLKLLIISSFLSGWCCLTLAQTVGTLSDLDSLLGCMSRGVRDTSRGSGEGLPPFRQHGVLHGREDVVHGLCGAC